MKLLADKTSLECILWSDLQVIFYVTHKSGDCFTYSVWYDANCSQSTRYLVEFLTDVVCFETISEVLRFIQCYDEASVDTIEIEITN